MVKKNYNNNQLRNAYFTAGIIVALMLYWSWGGDDDISLVINIMCIIALPVYLLIGASLLNKKSSTETLE